MSYKLQFVALGSWQITLAMKLNDKLKSLSDKRKTDRELFGFATGFENFCCAITQVNCFSRPQMLSRSRRQQQTQQAQ